MSPARAATYQRLLADWSIAEVGPVLDLGAEFGRRAGVVLDIGFGGGEATIELARARPDQDVLAIDVHTPGIGRLLESIERDRLTNVRVIDGDALVFVERIPAAILHEIRILFPDPWPKVRQRHRRLVRADVVATLTDRLVPGGTLHIATDVADYAAQVLAVCSAEPRLAGGIVERPVERTITRFEQRGIDAGREAVDLVFTRR
jgi:tRNA (guanine-N7-)-methyltransferase